jgi:hypothetical protein
MIVYIAQALDYAGGHEGHMARWFHSPYPGFPPGVEIYCPHCEFIPGETVQATMIRNTKALTSADALIGIYDGAPSFGMPVEIWTKAHAAAHRVCIIHPGKPGVYVRWLESIGVAVVGSAVEALKWVSVWSGSGAAGAVTSPGASIGTDRAEG